MRIKTENNKNMVYTGIRISEESMKNKKMLHTYTTQNMAERAAAGFHKYGTHLQTHNGRDALWDAYQEAMDLCMYLRQAILERDDNGLL